MNKKDIEKLVYKKEFFDLSMMKIGSKLITTITDDGVIVEKHILSKKHTAL